MISIKARVSVCMATYNGGHYIREQLESILSQLDVNDEIIVSDDGSTDRTIEIIRSIGDNRIKILEHRKKKNPWRIWGGDKKCYGVSSNFENSLRYAKGKYVFLCDQDDIWVQGRVDKTIDILKSNPGGLVICNFSLMDEEGNIYKESVRRADMKFNFFYCVKNNPFMGCQMAFDRVFYNKVLPFPKYTASHDLWLGLNAVLRNKLIVENEVWHLYRVYGDNVSSNVQNSLLFKLSYRVYLLVCLLCRMLLSTIRINNNGK